MVVEVVVGAARHAHGHLAEGAGAGAGPGGLEAVEDGPGVAGGAFLVAVVVREAGGGALVGVVGGRLLGFAVEGGCWDWAVAGRVLLGGGGCQ